MRNLPPYLFRSVHRIQSFFQKGRNALLSLFFPWPCAVCGELQPYPGVICEPCCRILPRIDSPYCKICGSPFQEHWRVKICPECQLERPRLTKIRSVFLYEQPLIQMIRETKFSRKARHLRYFSEELYLFLLARLPVTIDAIVPVPLHRAREWERTFDQAGLLARHLHDLCGLPVKNVLIRKKNTVPQTSLSGAARRRNLRNAFGLKRGARIPASILLIDDVITTGATLEACAMLLRKAGARRVYGLTIARAALK
jgi:ComF family protein